MILPFPFPILLTTFDTDADEAATEEDAVAADEAATEEAATEEANAVACVFKISSNNFSLVRVSIDTFSEWCGNGCDILAK